jgi:hypothetical protein
LDSAAARFQIMRKPKINTERGGISRDQGAGI